MSDNIVITTLVGEYVRARNRVDGAAARIEFSKQQLADERQLHQRFVVDRDMLADAIQRLGGSLPPVDEPEVPA